MSMNLPSDQSSPKLNPALKDLERLIGEWHLVGAHPQIHGQVRGHASFGWVEEGAFLVWHLDFEHPGPPSGVSVIGRDDSSGACSVLYFDERGVSRIYEMGLVNGIWTMWRNSSGFSQRMTGTIDDDQRTITVHWEKSIDGSHWEQDLDLTYTKVR